MVSHNKKFFKNKLFQNKKPYQKPDNPKLQTKKPEKFVTLAKEKNNKQIVPYHKPKIQEADRLSKLIEKTNFKMLGDKGNVSFKQLVGEQKSIMNDFNKMEESLKNIKVKPNKKEEKMEIVPYKPLQVDKLKQKSKKKSKKKLKKKSKKSEKKDPYKGCSQQTKKVVYEKKDKRQDKFYEMKQLYRKCNKTKKKSSKSSSKSY